MKRTVICLFAAVAGVMSAIALDPSKELSKATIECRATETLAGIVAATLCQPSTGVRTVVARPHTELKVLMLDAIAKMKISLEGLSKADFLGNDDKKAVAEREGRGGGGACTTSWRRRGTTS